MLCYRRLLPLPDRRDKRTNLGLRHTILCALARGDLEFWSGAEKLQMTAAWDSQYAFRRRRKGGRAMAVIMASSQKVRRQKI